MHFTVQIAVLTYLSPQSGNQVFKIRYFAVAYAAFFFKRFSIIIQFADLFFQACNLIPQVIIGDTGFLFIRVIFSGKFLIFLVKLTLSYISQLKLVNFLLPQK